MTKNCLIIKCDKRLTKEELNELYATFTKQADNGIILLPFFCDVICYPEEMIGNMESAIKILEA